LPRNKQTATFFVEGTGSFELYILQENNIAGSFDEYTIFVHLSSCDFLTPYYSSENIVITKKDRLRPPFSQLRYMHS